MVRVPEGDTRAAAFTRSGFRTGLVCLIIIAAIWIDPAIDLHERYRNAITDNEHDTRNLSRAFEENIRRAVEVIDTTIRALRIARASNPNGFNLTAWETDSGLTRDLALQLSLIDRNGLVTASNLPTTANAVSIADRPHFIETRDSPGDPLYISRPVVGRVSHRWSIQFVRKLIDAQGQFDGEIVASLDPSFLSRFSQSLDIGDGGLLLVGQDGIVRAAAPEQLVPLSADLSQTSLMHAAARASQGTLQSADFGDGHHRTYSWRRIEPYGLIVAIGLSTEDELADFHSALINSIATSIVLSLAVIMVGILLERRRRQLVASWELLHAAVENISQGLMVVDNDRHVSVINQRAIELLGLPARLAKPDFRFDELLAWQVSAGEFSAPEQTSVRNLVESGGLSPGSSSYRRTRRDGTVLEVRTQTSDGGLAVRTITDITEEQHSAAALAVARDIAEAAARARSEFLATMSHEIRTPLNGVLGLAELLADMELGPVQHDYVRMIRESGDHLLQLINDVLDFSRLEASRVQLEEVVFDPATVVKVLAELFRAQATRKGLHLSVTLTELPQAVLGDPGRLRQVLFNLVGNAIKFTDHGWIDITLAAELLDDQRVRLLGRVTDTGIGIDPGAANRMFEEFTQADGSISRRFGGSGLGLAICQRLIALMGGRIRVESTPHVGSAFHFDRVLKAAAALAPAASPADIVVSSDSRRLRVLIAEDNSTNRQVILHQLRRLGHQATAVEDGAKVVAACRAAPYDLILMDVMMPEMDGLTATRLIRSEEQPDRHLPIIGLTAGSQSEHLARCLAAGMDEVATKPITLSRLRDLLRPVVARAPASGAKPVRSRLEELRDELGPEVASEICATFAEDTRLRLQTLREAASQGDTKDVFRGAHNIAGAASNVGATALAHRAKQLEETVGRLSLADVVEAVSDMQRKFDEALSSLGITPAQVNEPEDDGRESEKVSHENAA